MLQFVICYANFITSAWIYGTISTSIGFRWGHRDVLCELLGHHAASDEPTKSPLQAPGICDLPASASKTPVQGAMREPDPGPVEVTMLHFGCVWVVSCILPARWARWAATLSTTTSWCGKMMINNEKPLDFWAPYCWTNLWGLGVVQLNGGSHVIHSDIVILKFSCWVWIYLICLVCMDYLYYFVIYVKST
jgi:hypothetical protein